MAAKMVAAHKKRLRKPPIASSLSVSMPDVSQDPASYDVQTTFQQFVETPFPPLLSNPAGTSAAKDNIDDDTWSEKADPTTGFVFHIDSSTKLARLDSQPSADGGPHPLTISHSSSSLSSTQSATDVVSPASPTAIVNSPVGLSSRFTQSLRLSSYPKVGEVAKDVNTPAVNDVFSLEQSSSLRKKIAKAVRGTSKRLRSRSYDTGSLSDLHFMEQHTPQLSSFPETLSSPSSLVESVQVPLPQTTLCGSRGVPLHNVRDLRLPSIRIDLSQFQLGVGLTPCSLDTLGIVPARSLIKGKFGSLSSLASPRHYSRSKFKQHYPPLSPSSSFQPVIIRGIIPGSPAAVTQSLHEGDTIQSVNGHSVNLENIDSILAGLSNEVHLIVHRAPNHEIPRRYHSHHANHTPSHVPGGLVRLVMGGKSAIRSHVHKLIEHPHLLLYLTLDINEEDPDEKDILYRFPSPSQHGGGGGGEEQERLMDLQRQLVRLRGVFLTLSDVLATLIGPSPSCSTILLDGHLLHVGYVQFDKELLLLAFPAAQVSQYQVQLIVDSTTKLLVLLYGSVTRAFSNPSHHSNLDHVFALMFDLLLGQPDDSTPVAFSSSSLPGLPTAPQLKIPADVIARLSTALSGLDSADHNNRQEIINLRRPFLLLGSCLFYRGASACSHLRVEQQKEVIRFCQAYRLLELTAVKSINQVVIWREVYLSQLESAEEDNVYLPHDGRTFLLIVGLEHTLVCMLMQEMKLHPSGEVTPPTIDAVYVDRARSLIMELKAQDLLAECDGRGLHSTPLPALMSADIALASVYTRSASFRLSHTPASTLGSRRQTETGTSSPARRRKSTVSVETSRQLDGSDSDEPKHNILEKPPSSVAALARSRTQSFLQLGNPKAKQKRKLSGPELQSINELSVRTAAAANNNTRTFRPAYMLTSGIDNILLHYVNLSPGRGALICPTYATPPKPVQSELLQCFQQTCLFVRKILRGRAAEGVACIESDSESDDDWSDEYDEEEEGEWNGRGGVAKARSKKVKEEASPFAPRASSVIEHGVLLHCSPSSTDKHKKQATPTLHYWVVGRLIRESDTELYVCFQDNMSQNLIEMSFRLLFGWPG